MAVLEVIVRAHSSAFPAQKYRPADGFFNTVSHHPRSPSRILLPMISIDKKVITASCSSVRFV
ncbi:MAG: hypothetical protein HY231_13315 [Acidobacteria bacterium]|nr:hypothetical protein [Acidobacteriota bacterium]